MCTNVYEAGGGRSGVGGTRRSNFSTRVPPLSKGKHNFPVARLGFAQRKPENRLCKPDYFPWRAVGRQVTSKRDSSKENPPLMPFAGDPP